VRLLELRANKPSFRTVTFNQTGVTLILGKKSKPNDWDRKKTYNGVGKSLIIALIHFCLGAKCKKAFKEKLDDWSFELDIQFQKEKVTLSRSPSNEKIIHWNLEPLSLAEVTDRLTSAFDIPEGIGNLSFRSLIKRFIRPARESYSSFDFFQKEENKKPQIQLLNNTFLLGYDPNLILEKVRLKELWDQTKSTRNLLKDDPATRSFFELEKSEVPLEILSLEEGVRTLEKNISSFKIAADFQAKEAEAQAAKKELHKLNNQIVVIKNTLESIEKSLQFKDDIPVAHVESLYSEAGFFFSDHQLKQLEDVINFHKSLVKKRQSRLLQERQKRQQKLGELLDQKDKTQIKFDNLMAYLGDHGALDDYRILSQQLADDKMRLEKLKTFDKLMASYDKTISNVKKDLETENQKAIDYLNSFSQVSMANNLVFRSFSKKLYTDKPGGITVINNPKTNKTRFDLEVHIETDSSDGVNEAKIFCFDTTLLLQKHNHQVEFLFHDSRLYSEIDPRQRATIFKEAMRFSEDSQVQYIASLNEDSLEAMKPYLAEGEFNTLKEAVVLELTDESPEKRLLGIKVDLKYED
jgi:uncharacterized protein YydD (DUF2326 family)